MVLARPGALLLSLAILASGCGDSRDEPGWVDADGGPVSTAVIVSFQGHEHCGWEDSTWVYLAGSYYLKDPDHVVYGVGDPAFLTESGRSQTATEDDLYRTLPELPPGARDSGLRYGNAELWTNSNEPRQAIYLVSGDLIERLPRTFAGCD